MGDAAAAAVNFGILGVLEKCPTCRIQAPSQAAVVNSVTVAAGNDIVVKGCNLVLNMNLQQFAEFMAGPEARGLNNFCQSLVATGIIPQSICDLASSLIKAAILAAGNALLAEVKKFCRNGGNTMACKNTHSQSSEVQGPGACCAALAKSGIAPAVGVRVAAQTSKGKCFICEIKASTSKAHQGALVFKRGKSNGPGAQCPTSTQGCCILQTAAAQTA